MAGTGDSEMLARGDMKFAARDSQGGYWEGMHPWFEWNRRTSERNRRLRLGLSVYLDRVAGFVCAVTAMTTAAYLACASVQDFSRELPEPETP